MARLQRLGPRTVPVLARGQRYIFAQSIEDVAEFVGLERTAVARLPPDVLIARWRTILALAVRYARQFPDARLDEHVLPTRPRPVRELAHHVFRVAEAFLETAEGGAEYSVRAANEPPRAALPRAADIAAFGEGVAARVEAWWAGRGVRDCAAMVPTYYGPQSLHQLLERSTWHCAQHVRQLADVLTRFGIAPEAVLGAADLDGLPMPEALWA